MKAYKIVTALLMALGLGISITTIMFAPKAGDYELLNFRFVHGPVHSHYENYHLDEVESVLGHSKYKKDEKTAFFIFGANETFDSLSTQTIINSYLLRHEHNLFIADWGDYSHTPTIDDKYLNLTNEIGVKMGRALKNLIGAGMNINNVYLIGNSLGSQIAATMSRQVNNNETTILRISALNPINVTKVCDKTVLLNVKDAKIVDVIYSDLEAINFTEPIGSINFFPNGGKIQPGCLSGTSCSLDRSFKYFAESVANKNAPSFKAIKCSDWGTFKKGNCDSTETSYMGLNVEKSNSSNFYLQTLPFPFYSKGDAGIKYEE